MKEDNWWGKELALMQSLNEPVKIQAYLDSLKFNPDNSSWSPKEVIQRGKAHCFEGAMLAAACLQCQGYPPLLMNLRAVNDDDHILALFKEEGRWGAISKSNFTTLRFREPVYLSTRELVMSYFDFYFNISGEKTLREYSIPLDLRRFEGWINAEGDGLGKIISDCLDRSRHYQLILPKRVPGLTKVSSLLLEAGLLGSDPEGLYRPEG